MAHSFLILLMVILFVFLFSFTNGFHDSSSQVAAVITARTLSPESALVLASLSTFLGAYFLGTRVAWTLGREIFSFPLGGSPEKVLTALMSGIASAILWNFLTWRWGLPSSSSHALVGGLVGAFLAAYGIYSLEWEKIKTIFLVMFLSPLVGFGVTYPFTKLTFYIGQQGSLRLNQFFKVAQILSLVAQSLCYGSNDAQKGMGIIALALFVFLSGNKSNFSPENWIPQWVLFLSSFTLALGILMGGWRLIRTLGRGLYPVKAMHGFASQTTSAALLYCASLFGYPLSSTQVVSASILGAGAAFRPKSVRWTVAGDLTLAWAVTIPVCAGVAALAFKLLELIVL